MLALVVGFLFMSAVPALRGLGPVLAEPSAPTWLFVLLFGLSDSFLVHFRFRRDAHSLSLADIPQVVGLFLLEPLVLISAHMVGSFLALVARGVRGLKLWFNLVAFFSQYIVSIGVFRAVLGDSDPLGSRGAAGAVLGSIAALVFAQSLISMAITLSGGSVSRRDQIGVLSIGSLVVSLGASLGFLTVTLAYLRVSSVWLALIPIIVMAIGYRAYSSQRDERARITVLHNLTLGLHGSRLIDDAVLVTANGLREMFEVEAVHVLLGSGLDNGLVHRTSVSAGGLNESMVPMVAPDSGMWPSLWRIQGSLILRGLRPTDIALPGWSAPRCAMVTPLLGSGCMLGLVVISEPMSSVASFTQRDLRLLHTVAERLVVSLENGRLEDSLAELKSLKDRLEALIRSKDEFIAAVSHELRTPLTGILGLAEVLNTGSENLDPSELPEFLSIISEQSKELGYIIEDLLVAARADTGTLVIKRTEVDLTDLVRLLLDQLHPAPGQRIIGPELGEGSVALESDPLRLRQILRNLITNAIRYGGEEVRISARVLGSTAQVVVADNGDGVDAESVGRIFEPYGQRNTSTAAPGSVGIGLSVSRRLARLLGGEVTYRRRDSWTEFMLEVPTVSETDLALDLSEIEVVG